MLGMKRVTIASSVEKICNVTNQRTLVNESIQIALNRVFASHDFPYYLQEATLQTTDDYTTGTVDVTNGSTTVTGTGTTFTAAMVGRKFRASEENAYYKIGAFVSTTEITLEHAYQGDTDTDADYKIYKDEYRLAADVDKYKVIRQVQNAVPPVQLLAYHL